MALEEIPLAKFLYGLGRLAEGDEVRVMITTACDVEGRQHTTYLTFAEWDAMVRYIGQCRVQVQFQI